MASTKKQLPASRPHVHLKDSIPKSKTFHPQRTSAAALENARAQITRQQKLHDYLDVQVPANVPVDDEFILSLSDSELEKEEPPDPDIIPWHQMNDEGKKQFLSMTVEELKSRSSITDGIQNMVERECTRQRQTDTRHCKLTTSPATPIFLPNGHYHPAMAIDKNWPQVLAAYQQRRKRIRMQQQQQEEEEDSDESEPAVMLLSEQELQLLHGCPKYHSLTTFLTPILYRMESSREQWRGALGDLDSELSRRLSSPSTGVERLSQSRLIPRKNGDIDTTTYLGTSYCLDHRCLFYVGVVWRPTKPLANTLFEDRDYYQTVMLHGCSMEESLQLLYKTEVTFITFLYFTCGCHKSNHTEMEL